MIGREAHPSPPDHGRGRTDTHEPTNPTLAEPVNEARLSADHRPSGPGRDGSARRDGRMERAVVERPGRGAATARPDFVWKIEIVDGVEGQALAERQARILMEVTAWVSQRRSETGQRPAA